MSLTLPTLNLLRAFDAAGQHLSFKLAAEQLFVTPSAVSQQINTLEEQLGLSLFIRGNRSLVLTDDGHIYWRKIHYHLGGIREATLELQHRNVGDILKVSIMPPVSKRVVLPRLADFQRQYPSIQLRLDSSPLDADLQSGALDLGIRFGSPPWRGLAHEKLIDVSIVLLCPPVLSERYLLKNDPHNILKMPLIQMTNRPGTWWKNWFSHYGIDNPASQQYHVDDYPAAIEASETLGATLGLFPIEVPLIESGRVAAPYPPLGPLNQAIYAVYTESQKNNPMVQAFVNWLRSQLESLG